MDMLRWLQIVVLCLAARGAFCGEQEAKKPYLYCQRKWKEVKWEGLRIHILKLRAEQFPPGKNYTLFIRNCDGSKTPVLDYKSNRNGHLIVDLKGDLKEAAPFAITPLRKGEKVCYSMFSEDRSEEVMTTVVPFPIEVSKNGTSVAIEILDAKGAAFVCVGQGFRSEEELQVLCRSGEKSSQETIQADSQGSFKYPLWPSVEGEETGTASVTVRRKQGELVVPFAWGRQAQEFVGAICLQIR